jgi:hypothetical protein
VSTACIVVTLDSLLDRAIRKPAITAEDVHVRSKKFFSELEVCLLVLHVQRNEFTPLEYLAFISNDPKCPPRAYKLWSRGYQIRGSI